LPNDQEVFCAKPRPPEDFDLLSCTRMEGIVDANELFELFAGTM
jgi:hypothetical protein